MRLLGIYSIILILLLTMSSLPVQSDEYIEIERLTANIIDNNINVDCEITYQLNNSVNDALSNGIEMLFRLEIELMQKKTYWLDESLASIMREFRVKYHALSKQYVMLESGSNIERTFPDLYSAFYYQRHLHNAALGSASLIEAGKDYYVRARARLISENLPIPLRIKSYLYSDWRPSSGWTIWPM